MDLYETLYPHGHDTEDNDDADEVPEVYEDSDLEAPAYDECSPHPGSQNSAPYQTRLQPATDKKKFKFYIKF